MSDRESLVYFPGSQIVYSTNVFVDVPVILQYDDTPLIEVKPSLRGDVSEMVFSILNDSGDELAVVRGPRVFATEAGEAAGWDLRQEARLVACTVAGRTVFEVRRDAPMRLATSAELFAPDGRFLTAAANSYLVGFEGDEPWQIGGVTMMNNTFKGFDIGVQVTSTGQVGLGVNKQN